LEILERKFSIVQKVRRILQRKIHIGDQLVNNDIKLINKFTNPLEIFIEIEEKLKGKSIFSRLNKTLQLFLDY
jgi:hypothetical protein